MGAFGVAWGAYSQKAASIATGFNRLGVPAVVQSHSVMYRRAFLGRTDKKEDWEIIDARDGTKVYCEPAPEHLLYVAETKEEAIAYCERHRIPYELEEPNEASRRVIAYSDNFAYTRRSPWTH